MSCLSRAILLGLAVAVLTAAHTFRQDNCRSGNAGMFLAPPLVRERVLDLGAPTISSPVVVNDTLYIGGRDSCVHAFAGGAEIWKRNSLGWVDATPAYAGDRLYAPSRSGVTYDLDCRSGESLGVFVATMPLSSPVVFDSVIVFGRGEGNREVKAFHTGTRAYSWYTMNDQPVFSSPAVKDTTLVYGDDGGGLVALNARTGEPRWKVATGGGVYLSSPAIDGDVVFFSPGDYDKAVYAVRLGDGSLLWRTEGDLEASTVPLGKELVRNVIGRSPAQQRWYLSRLRSLAKIGGSQIEALQALASGQVSAGTFAAAGGAATSSPAVGDSSVFVSRMEYGYGFLHRWTLIALDKRTGGQRWSYSDVVRVPEPAGFCSSPLVCGATVVACQPTGTVLALDCRDGSLLWQDSLAGEIYASPAAAGGRLYVATTAGTIALYRQVASAVESFRQGTFCYPNPARGTVSTIRVCAQRPAVMTMTLYNSNEKPVLRLTKDITPGSPLLYRWDIGSVANGVYFALVKVRYGDGSEEKKTLKVAVLR